MAPALNDLLKQLSLKNNTRQSDNHRGSLNGLRLPSLSCLTDLDNGLMTVKSMPKPKEIPLVFHSLEHYMVVMHGNIEAEYYEAVSNAISVANSQEDCWHYFSQNKEGNMIVPDLRAGAKDGKADAQNVEKESWTNHIIQIQGSMDLLFVKYFNVETGEVILPISALTEEGQVRSLGYIGSHLLQFSSVSRLTLSTLVKMVLNPSVCEDLKCGDSYFPIRGEDLKDQETPINDSQVEALLSLKGGLEVIHGPPGTGKSTTIWHIVNSLLLPGSQCLITCCRNQAVEAVIDKVSCFGALVFGNDDRLGPKGKMNTLTGHLKRDSEVLFWDRIGNILSRFLEKFDRIESQLWRDLRISYQGIANLQKNGKKTVEGSNGAQLWFDALKKILPDIAMRLRLSPAELKFYNIVKRKLRGWKALVSNIATHVHSLRKTHILSQTRLYLCTIDSTSRMAKALAEHEVDLKLDTCIVDEAGCVLEVSIPILLRFCPNNLLLIGDHKQLQPFSSVQVDQHRVTNHTRSLLERAVLCGVKAKTLTMQYRMHPSICSIVSDLFYENQLTTSSSIVRDNKNPCIWFDGHFQETKHVRRGYSNSLEAEKVLELVKILIESNPKSTIFVITFYNKQRLEIMKLLERDASIKSEMNKDLISVLSVDKCQGSEADYVILSTVRSSGVTKFLQDKRRVCVALSRAKQGMWIVGNHQNFMLRGGSMWKKITNHFTKFE